MSTMFGPNKYAREPIEDSGWVEVTLTDTTNFALYGSQPIRVRQMGRAVYLTGALNLSTAGYVDTTTERVFATIPAEFRPVAPQLPVYACQGSSTNRWCLRVNQNGDLVAHRYGPNASGVGTWLPFNVSWLLD